MTEYSEFKLSHIKDCMKYGVKAENILIKDINLKIISNQELNGVISYKLKIKPKYTPKESFTLSCTSSSNLVDLIINNQAENTITLYGSVSERINKKTSVKNMPNTFHISKISYSSEIIYEVNSENDTNFKVF